MGELVGLAYTTRLLCVKALLVCCFVSTFLRKNGQVEKFGAASIMLHPSQSIQAPPLIVRDLPKVISGDVGEGYLSFRLPVSSPTLLITSWPFPLRFVFFYRILPTNVLAGRNTKGLPLTDVSCAARCCCRCCCSVARVLIGGADTNVGGGGGGVRNRCMTAGLLLSTLISNHTAPVLCVSILMPIIRDFGVDSR